jgi:hypothetical protein
MKPNLKRLDTGRSGHLAVMAELLARGCNVAIPEVDVGDHHHAAINRPPSGRHDARLCGSSPATRFSGVIQIEAGGRPRTSPASEA